MLDELVVFIGKAMDHAPPTKALNTIYLTGRLASGPGPSVSDSVQCSLA
jgi:hypothetical protein